LRYDRLDSFFSVFTGLILEFFSGRQKVFEGALKRCHLFFDADIGIKRGRIEVVPNLIGRRLGYALQEDLTRILEFVGWTAISAHIGCS
jgi:hypothetical protein